MLLAFEIILSFGGYFYFYVYSNLDDQKIEKDAFRILFIGESTTKGSQVNPGHDYPSQIERILQQKYPNKKIKSYNKGVISIETTAILRNLDKNMIKYKPHLVVLMAGYNEYFIYDNTTFQLKNLYSQFKIYRLIVSIKDFLKIELWSDGNFRYIWNGYHYRPSNPISQLIFNLNSITQKVHSYGSDIWLAGYLQPDAREKVNPILQTVAEENSIIYMGDYPEVDFDMWVACPFRSSDVRKQSNRAFFDGLLSRKNAKNISQYSGAEFEGNCSLFADDNWHPSKEGYKAIAEKIAETIINQGIVDRYVKQG